MAGAVELGRLVQALRDRGGEERAHDQHVVGRKAQRQHQHPHGVEQAQILVEQVLRDQAGAEVHGEHQDEREHRPPLQAADGERIRRADGDEHADDGEQQRDKHGIEHGVRQLAVLEDRDVRVKIEPLGPQIHRLGHDRRVGGHALGSHMDERKDTGEREQEDDQRDDEIAHANAVDAGKGGRLLCGFGLHDCSPFLTAIRLRQAFWQPCPKRVPGSGRPATGTGPPPSRGRSCRPPGPFHRCRWPAGTGNP